MTRTWAVLSANSIRDYSFSLPLTALFWREVIGYSPICLIVEDWTKEERSRIALEALRHHGFRIVHVGEVPGYQSANVAQNVREHAAALEFVDELDWLLMSDADLWPLRRDFYYAHQESGKRAVLYYANGDHFQGKTDVLEKYSRLVRFQTIPTCSVTMRAETWRALYGYVPDNVAASTKKTMDWWLAPRLAGKPPSEVGWLSWMSDQDIVTYKVVSADWFPQEALLIERRGHPPVDRIDRGGWPAGAIDFGRYTDAHILRAPDQPENWAKLRPIIAHFLPQHLAWADDYQQRHVRSYA